MALRFFRALSLALLVQSVWAQTPPPVLAPQPLWHQLSPAQRQILEPLAQEWNKLPEDRRLKWLGIATRYPKMTPVEQNRLQERMKAWAGLSPAEREKARAQYQKLRSAPPEQRKAMEQRWQEYDALPSEEKKRLQEAPRKPLAPQASASAPRIPDTRKPPKAVLIAPASSSRPAASRK